MPNKQVPEQWLQDKDLVVESLQDAHMENVKLRASLNTLEQRVLSLERASAKQDMRLSALKAKLSAGRVHKEPKFSVKPATKINLNERLNALSSKLNPSVSKFSDTSHMTEKNGYTAAYLALKSARYDEATTGFLTVIKAYPHGSYIDQTYYWLGESLVAQYRNEEAVAAFMMVVQKYRQSAKHAPSLLKLALIHQKLKQYGDARAVLQRVLKEHAGSPSAASAQSQLDNLRQKVGERK